MKLSTKICVAALAASMAYPALAQRIPVGGSSDNKQAPDGARPQETGEETTTTTAATLTTGRKLDISKGAQKAIVDLQTAVNANDVATIPAKLAAAQAVAKTNDDKFAIASNQTRAALKANDIAGIRAGIEALQASGAAETPDLAARYTDLGRRYKEAGKVDEALAMLNKAMALNPNNVSTLVNLASIRDAQGQKAEAVALMQKSFLASKAAGTKVEEGNYKFATGLAYGQRLPVASELARQWVAAYPSPASWRDSLRIYRDLNKPAQSQLIDLLRLGRAAKALSGESDYFALGSALVSTGKLAEAKALLAEAKVAPNVDSTKRAFTDLTARVCLAPGFLIACASSRTSVSHSRSRSQGVEASVP